MALCLTLDVSPRLCASAEADAPAARNGERYPAPAPDMLLAEGVGVREERGGVGRKGEGE